MSDLYSMIGEIQRDIGDIKQEVGSTSATMAAIDSRMNEIVQSWAKGHEALAAQVEKNTKYRQYIKGALAMLFLLGAYIGWQLTDIHKQIQGLLH